MTATAPATRRINSGRGHSYRLDGERVPSITEVLGEAWPKPALIGWAAGCAADWAADNYDSLAEMSTTARANTIRKNWRNAGKEAALRGTIIHDYAHRLALGEEIEVPDDYRDHVDAYLAFAEEWEPAELMVELPVFSRRYRYAGTPDLVAVLKDGRTWILDWKTGAKGGVFVDYVLQLAAARFADFTLTEEGVEVPIPHIDAAGIVTLTADGFRLIPVEANINAFRVFRMLRYIATEMVKQPDAWIGDPL
jgi:hypothetical protein